MDNTEIWRPIRGFEGLYEVSNHGRVRGVERIIKHNKGGAILKKAGLLKGSINPKGYSQVKLSVDGKTFIRSVHRLVAFAFLAHATPELQVNHKDLDKLNNHVANLAVVMRHQKVNQALTADITPLHKPVQAPVTQDLQSIIISVFKRS